MMTGNAPDTRQLHPVTWFAVLERARADRNYERAAEALRELRRLGIDIRYRPSEGVTR
jgi:hypothetical protein